MSLINDMLRDLDSRNAAGGERKGLSENVRSLPHKAERRMPPLVLALLAAGLGGAAVWLMLRPSAPAPAAPPPTAAAPIVAIPAAPTNAVPPSVETVTDTAMPPPPAALPELGPVAVQAPVAETQPLRLDTKLDIPPAVVTKPALPTSKPVHAVEPPAKVASLSAPGAIAPASAKPVDTASRNTAQPQISKQPIQAATAAEQAETEYRRGITALRQGDSTQAGDAFRSALRSSPIHVGARQALLGLLTEQQRWGDTETLALDGVSLLPQHSEWALLAARLMYERGDTDLALTTLNEHASAARRNADYQVMHALLLLRAGRNADAVDCYKSALSLRPGEGRWWFGLGRALDADRRDGEARQAYEKARDSGNLPPDLQQNVERRLRQS